MPKTDLRVVKTKRNIRETLIKLLLEKDFTDITVQELLERALINRSTFYRYYTDKYALAEELANDFLALFQSVMKRRAETLDVKNVLNGVDLLLEQMMIHRDTFRALLKIHTERVHVLEDLQVLLQQGFVSFYQKVYGSADCDEFQAYMFSTIVLANLRFAVDHTETYDAKKMLEQMTDFFKKIPTPYAAR